MKNLKRKSTNGTRKFKKKAKEKGDSIIFHTTVYMGMASQWEAPVEFFIVLLL
jgi:hypothetical protein